MPDAVGTRFSLFAALLFSSVTFPCLKPTAALSPLGAWQEKWGAAAPATNSPGSPSVECAAEIIRAHRVGPPMVGVVSAGRIASLPHLVATLQRPPETPVLLLAYGKRARGNSGPSTQSLLSRNMSHAVFLSSPAAPFHRLFEQVTHDPHWSPTTMHLVVASTAEAMGSDGGAEVRAVLNLAWRHWVSNIAVVVPTKEVDEPYGSRISVITHFPYTSGGICGRDSSRIEEVAVWRGGRFIRGDSRGVYPEKFGDLQGCIVNVTVFDSPPACILKGKGQQEDEVARVDGVHGLLLAEAAKRMNFTPRYHQFFPQRYRNSSNPFWNLFPPLLEHHTDMILCEVVLTPTRHHILGEGFHHQWECSTFAVPISHPGSSWRLFGLATPTAWMALLASIALSCAASWAINKLRPHLLCIHQQIPHSKVTTDALVAFAGVTIQRPPVALSSRVFFPAVCLGGLIATTAIRSQLSSFLSAPDTSSWAPSSLEEMVESKMQAGGPMAYKFLANGMVSKAWKAVLRHYEVHDEGIEALDIEGVAVAGMRRNLLYRLSQQSREKVVLKECPLPLPTIIALPKGTPFHLELKKIDTGLASGGIIAKWMRDLTSNTTYNRTALKYVNSEKKRKISVSEMKSVFIFHSLGLLASLIVFISEWLKYTHKR